MAGIPNYNTRLKIFTILLLEMLTFSKILFRSVLKKIHKNWGNLKIVLRFLYLSPSGWRRVEVRDPTSEFKSLHLT